MSPLAVERCRWMAASYLRQAYADPVDASYCRIVASTYDMLADGMLPGDVMAATPRGWQLYVLDVVHSVHGWS